MKKKQFLKKLEDNLELLEEKERNKIIKKYETKIEDDMADGKSESEAVSNLGDVETVIKETLKEYKINPNYETNKKKETKSKRDDIGQGIAGFINSIIDGIDNFIAGIGENDSKKIMQIVLYVIVIMFGIWILRIPFWIIEEIGTHTFDIFDSPFDSLFMGMWIFIINIIYLIIIITIIVAVVKRYNKKENQQATIKTSSKTDLEETTNAVYRLFMLLIKIIIIFFTLPLFFVLFGLVMAVGVLIILLIKGVLVVGPLLIIIGLIIVISSLISWLYHLLFGKGGLK